MGLSWTKEEKGILLNPSVAINPPVRFLQTSGHKEKMGIRGKSKLYPFFAELIKKNELFGSEYCEPYAGGAGLALRLLSMGYVERISINDIDRSIYAFWVSVLQDTGRFCALIEKTPVDVNEWHRQKAIWTTGDARNVLALGFSAFFLNRTNRSGIIEGAGPIGGYNQNGPWKIDARLIRDRQIANIESLSRYADQIRVSNLDAEEFIGGVLGKRHTLVYLDPPYFSKGSKLYKNFYHPDDHIRIAKRLERERRAAWVVSYDDVPEIRQAYQGFCSLMYSLNYSAGEKTLGTEVIFLSDALAPPTVDGYRAAA